VLAAIGGAHAARGEWAEALAAYEQAAAEQAKAAAGDDALAGEALYGACLALHKLGKHAESTHLAERLLRELPDHRLRDHAALAVAENLFAAQKYAEVEKAYAPLARREGPFARDARFKGAWSIYLQGRQAEAAAAFASLSETKDAAHAEESLSMLALAALEAGDHARALEAADRYRARYPQGQFLARTERVASRSLQASGDLTAAARRLTAAATAEGHAERGRQDRLEVAELMFKKSDFTAAADAYAELAAGDDAVAARALEGAAWCAFELGDDARTLDLLDRALAHPGLGARLPDALQLRCATLQRAKRFEEAAAVAQRFLVECGQDPRAREMQFALGVALARAEQPEAARQALAALAGAGGGPHPDRTAYELAWACRKTGDEPGALAAFAKVVELTQDEELAGEARLHLGEALLADGKPEAARPLLEAVRGQHRPRAL
jgi:TolA-binding protein